MMKPFTWSLVSSFALCAFASPVPDSLLRYLDNRAITVTDAQVQQWDFYAEYAAAAFCNNNNTAGSPIFCDDGLCARVTAAGTTVVGTFGAALTDAKGFVATDPTNKLIVASIMGSLSIRNWITDFVFTQASCDVVSGCLLHTGFLTGYNEIQADLVAHIVAAQAANPDYKVIFTGHSMGGAILTVAAAYLRKAGYAIDLYTFGSPRVGNKEFVDFVSNQAGSTNRITHVDDPVPRLPPIILNYRHTTPEYWLSTGTTDTIEYTAADIKVCEGYSNVDCNAGTFGLNTEAHSYYFEKINGCQPDGVSFRRRATDEELEAKVNDYVEKDIELAATLPDVWS